MSVTVVFCDPTHVETQRTLMQDVESRASIQTFAEWQDNPRYVISQMYMAREAIFCDETAGVFFDVEFGTCPLPFMAMLLHVEAGGLCVATRDGRMWATFGKLGAPDFDWSWPDATFYLLHTVEVMTWEERFNVIRARLAQDTANNKRPIRA